MSKWLLQRFYDYGERDFLAQGDACYTYSKLIDSIREYSSYFAGQGIQTGDVVTLEADYSLPAIAALLALFELKAVVAPIAAVSESELKERRSAASARWNICLGKIDPTPKLLKSWEPEKKHPLIQKLTYTNRAGLILFSSGSTGKPKAMVHDADQLLGAFEKKQSRKRRILVFLLFDHIGGLNTLFHALASGACIIVPHSRDPNDIGVSIQQHQVNLLPASPTFLNLFLLSGAHQRFDLSSLRFITYGTEPMPQSLLLRLKTAFPKVSFIQTFGTSETGIAQTVGKSSQNTGLRIVDPKTEHKVVNGELWLRSKTQALGYLNHDMSRFTKDGWFKTGDVVEESEDGFFTIKGRSIDVMNVGGEKVVPLEIETVLLEIPEVADCLVYGETSPITGQIVVAKVFLSTNTVKSPKELRRKIKQYCRKKLSPYKVPARITFEQRINVTDRYKKNRKVQ